MWAQVNSTKGILAKATDFSRCWGFQHWPQFPVASNPLNKVPVLILCKGQTVEHPDGQQWFYGEERAEWVQVEEVRLITALSDDVTGERHFSWHGEYKKHRPKVHIKHNISVHALRPQTRTDTSTTPKHNATWAQPPLPLVQKGGLNLSGSAHEKALCHFPRETLFSMQKLHLITFHTSHITLDFYMQQANAELDNLAEQRVRPDSLVKS